MGRRRLMPGELGTVNFSQETGTSVRGRARVRDADGTERQVTATGPDRATVEHMLRRRAAGIAPPRLEWSASTSLGACLAAHIDRRLRSGRIQSHSADMYRRILRQQIDPLIGHFTVSSLTSPLVSHFMAQLEYAGVAVSTRRTTLFLLRAGLDLAIRRGCIPGPNPAQSEARPWERRPAPIALTPDQVEVVRDVVLRWEQTWTSGAHRRPTLRLGLELCLATGLRIGEVLAIRACDVEGLQPGTGATVAVTGTIVRGRRDDGKTFLIRQTYLKGHAPHPRLPLPAFGVAAVREALSARIDDDPTATLLQGTHGGLMDPATFRSRLREAKRLGWEELLAAGIDADELSPHTLRRTVLSARAEHADGGLALANCGRGTETPSSPSSTTCASQRRRPCSVRGPTT